ncbi:hypothetical protein HDU97_005138 [Phlyctochytrium planicorne]|nr:hypothetical protein HDU97_005138 [Phlyctochytrium planicorne]
MSVLSLQMIPAEIHDAISIHLDHKSASRLIRTCRLFAGSTPIRCAAFKEINVGNFEMDDLLRCSPFAGKVTGDFERVGWKLHPELYNDDVFEVDEDAEKVQAIEEKRKEREDRNNSLFKDLGLCFERLTYLDLSFSMWEPTLIDSIALMLLAIPNPHMISTLVFQDKSPSAEFPTAIANALERFTHTKRVALHYFPLEALCKLLQSWRTDRLEHFHIKRDYYMYTKGDAARHDKLKAYLGDLERLKSVMLLDFSCDDTKEMLKAIVVRQKVPVLEKVVVYHAHEDYDEIMDEREVKAMFPASVDVNVQEMWYDHMGFILGLAREMKEF